MIYIFCYFRCKTPNDNDYYTPPGEVSFNTSHGVQSYNVTECHIQINGTMSKCNSWVYDKSLFTATIISKVIHWYIDWLISWLIDWSIDRLIDWSVDWSIGLLIDWLVFKTNISYIYIVAWIIQWQTNKCHTVRAVQKWTRNS